MGEYRSSTNLDNELIHPTRIWAGGRNDDPNAGGGVRTADTLNLNFSDTLLPTDVGTILTATDAHIVTTRIGNNTNAATDNRIDATRRLFLGSLNFTNCAIDLRNEYSLLGNVVRSATQVTIILGRASQASILRTNINNAAGTRHVEIVNGSTTVTAI